jgi:FlaA1/EpsC-like NDP-sugar epimerase
LYQPRITKGDALRSIIRKYLIRLPRLLVHQRPLFIPVVQAMLVIGSFLLSWLLRFDFSLPYRRTLLTSGLLLLVVRLITLRLFNLNHGWWHFASVSDALSILKAVITGSVVFFSLNRYLLSAIGFPRAIYILEAVLTASFLAGARLISRVLVESIRRDSSHSKRVILVGAGFAAQMVIRELARPNSGYVAVGCVDDDRSKIGVHIQGVPVLGTIEELQILVEDNPAEEILIAIPSASGKQMRRITDACQKAKLPFKTVPTLSDIIRGEANINQFREVSLEDLLGREPVQIDLESVHKGIAGRTIIVTGAAGSIGSELCRQILEYGPDRLVCLDQSETGLFYLRLELDRHKNGAQVTFCVADVTDCERVRRILSEVRPELIFHAAAYKHVPMMESNVQEAVKNNVLGLLGLLGLADEAGCKDFVLISSDKAVNPTNIMGATKRTCELILSSRPQNGMRCVSVRFGNVLGSNGSVVPVLTQQLHNHEPLTVTHPDIKRFFMTTREAVALVLQAFVIGKHGDILVLDMGEQVKIVDLARTLIRLSGKSEREVEIRFTGLREGEKLSEELFYEHEEIIPTSCEKIKRTKGPLRDWSELCLQLEELRASMSVDGAAPVRTKMKEIVPEYSFHSDISSQPCDDSVAGHRFRAAAGHH